MLALALPAPEAVQTVIVPARGGWLTWPAVRWGFATAGVIAIVALGVVQLQRRPMSEAARQTARVETPAGQTQTQPTAPPAAAARDEKQEKSLAAAPSSENDLLVGKPSAEFRERKLMARAAAPRVSAQQSAGVGGAASGVAHNQFVHGPQPPTQWQQQNNRVQAFPPVAPSEAQKQEAADLVANRKIPSSSQTVEVEAPSQAAPVNANAEAQNRVAIQDQESRTQAQPGQPEAQGNPLGGPVGKAKPPVEVEAANVAAPQADAGSNAQELPVATGTPGLNARNLTQLAAPAPARLPRWTISSAGGLQRSFDQGKTWQDVDVNANMAPSAGFSSFEVVAKAARAKENNADKKDLKAPIASVVFRAVTAMGAEVWAGGSNGALYHSADAGGHWTQVVPSSGGTILSGDIVVMEFSDPQHGRITTSTAEVWITGDGGQTWQKQ